ncbi:hypothetical protein RJT34_22616 [Clitoria ternatea]|uniref:Uncharacterized protein n=1 Tax=Clitoria ternatea TaxID=43366 RepID=A0AAN9IKV7_CLITE
MRWVPMEMSLRSKAQKTRDLVSDTQAESIAHGGYIRKGKAPIDNEADHNPCLCDVLVNNSSIQKLKLNSADLGDEGAKAIVEMLKKNSSLQVLELNNNMIEYSELHLHANSMEMKKSDL